MNSGFMGSTTAQELNDTFLCKLFGDRVTADLCALRRRELIAKGDFSCEGCSMLVAERS